MNAYEMAKSVRFQGGTLKLHKFISPKDFVAYLKTQVKENRVYKCDSFSCPLAEATGFVVGNEGYGLLVIDKQFVGPTRQLPQWAQDFTVLFDNKLKFPGVPKEKSAERALFIMKNLKDIVEAEELREEGEY